MVRTGRIAGFFRRLGIYRKPILILATPGDGRKISQTILSHALHHSLATETHLIAVFRGQSSFDSFNHVCENMGVSSSSKLYIHHILLETKPERDSFFVHWEKEFLQQKVKRIQFLLAGGAQEVLLNTYENTRKMKSFRKTPVELLLGDELDETHFPDGYTHERWFSLHQDMVEKSQDSTSYRIQLSPSEDDVFDLYCLPSEKKNRVAFAVFLELNKGPREWFQFATKLDSMRPLHTSLLLDVHMPRRLRVSLDKGIPLNPHHLRERKWLRHGIPFDSGGEVKDLLSISHIHSFSVSNKRNCWNHQLSLGQEVGLIPLEHKQISSQDLDVVYISLEEATTPRKKSPLITEKMVLRLESRRELRSMYNAIMNVNRLHSSLRKDVHLCLLIDEDFKLHPGFYNYVLDKTPETEFVVASSKIDWTDSKIHFSVEGFQGKNIIQLFTEPRRISETDVSFYSTSQELTTSVLINETNLSEDLLSFFLVFNHHFEDWGSARTTYYGENTKSMVFNDSKTVFRIIEILDSEIRFSLAGIRYTWTVKVKPEYNFGPEFAELILSLLGHISPSNESTVFTPTILSDSQAENIPLSSHFLGDSHSLFLHEADRLGQRSTKGKFPDLFACHRVSANDLRYSIVDAKGRFGFATEKQYSTYYSSTKGNLSKYSIGLQGFPVSIICAQFFAHDDPSSLSDSVPSLDIFLQCKNSGFTLKIFDLNAPCWEQGVTIEQLREFLFDEVLHPEKENWRFENWLQSKLH